MASPLPIATEQAIIARAVQLDNYNATAREFNVAPSTVMRIIKRFRAQRPAEMRRIERKESRAETHARLTELAIKAMESGLGCDDDPYKRGALGVQVAKGTGLLSDTPAVQVNALFAAIPADWRGDYKAAGEVSANEIGGDDAGTK